MEENLLTFNLKELHNAHWFACLSKWQGKLVDTSIDLFNRELASEVKMDDYSFIIFSMSKAYEGFLKKFLYQMRLINKETYEGKRFRIGRALNPDVGFRQRDEFWLYDDVAQICGPDQAREIWDTWLVCRNRVFHFFPKEKGMLDLSQVRFKLEKLIKAMETASACIKEDN
jgi:hypothetical protein